MNVQLNDSGVPIIRQKTFAQKVKTFLLWTILVILVIAAGLLVYLCLVGASEMAALTTLKKISDQPYYTMTYENFDYSDMANREVPDNGAMIDFYKKKFFKVFSDALPGEYKNDYFTKGSLAFYGRSFTADYMRGRIYNSYDAPVLMVIAKPENGYKSWNLIDMSDVGMLSGQDIDPWVSNTFQTVAATYCVSEGINSELFGASLISCPTADCKDTSLVNITPFMAIRLMLDRAATVDSAIDLLKDYDIDFSCGTYQFFISEKKGKSAIIEYVGGSMSVIYHKSGVFHQICTNRMEDPSLRAAEKDYSNRYEENTLYTVFDRDLTASYDSGLGQALSYMKLLMIDKSSPMKTVDEYHAGTDQYGTLYIVLYDFLRMKMHVIVKGDTKSQSYTYDLQ